MSEKLKFNDLKTEVECIHPTNGKAFRWGYKPVITKFYYCPMCGEKL